MSNLETKKEKKEKKVIVIIRILDTSVEKVGIEMLIPESALLGDFQFLATAYLEPAFEQIKNEFDIKGIV